MSKVRTDSWAAALTEEQSWQLYYKARGLRWNEAADWAVKEFGIASVTPKAREYLDMAYALTGQGT